MKQKTFFIIVAMMLLVPMGLFGQTYSDLWKEVRQAQNKDLPKTAISHLEKIEKKAQTEKAYGQLMRSTLLHAQLMAEVAPDSLAPAVVRLANKSFNFSVEERVEMIKEAVKDNPKVEVTSDNGLTVEFAKKHNATHLIRGLRAVSDFEYEFQLASANEFIDSKIDTVFLMARGDKTFISSSSIMTMAKSGIDVSKLVPESVSKKLK